MPVSDKENSWIVAGRGAGQGCSPSSDSRVTDQSPPSGHGVVCCTTTALTRACAPDSCPATHRCVEGANTFACVEHVDACAALAAELGLAPGAEVCQNGGGPCESRPQEGGRPPVATCTCAAGFSGKTCGVPAAAETVDRCAANAAEPHRCDPQGGSCVDRGTHVECACNEGFEGVFCERRVAQRGCLSSSEAPCLNGGTCVPTSDTTHECVCLDGWSPSRRLAFTRVAALVAAAVLGAYTR